MVTELFVFTELYTKSKTNLNSAEDATRGPHAKVLTIDYHWFITPEFLYEHEDDWPQGNCKSV